MIGLFPHIEALKLILVVNPLRGCQKEQDISISQKVDTVALGQSINPHLTGLSVLVWSSEATDYFEFVGRLISELRVDTLFYKPHPVMNPRDTGHDLRQILEALEVALAKQQRDAVLMLAETCCDELISDLAFQVFDRYIEPQVILPGEAVLFNGETTTKFCGLRVLGLL